MPLFRGSVAHVRAKILGGTLISVLTEQFGYRLGHRPSPAEVRSWRRSLDVLASDLSDCGLGDVEMLIEYQLPLTSKRADVVLCGTHPRTGRDHYVVVELKQWSDVTMLTDAEDICILPGQGERLHPIEQVRRYCRAMSDFVAVVSADPSAVSGVAYLHNATDLGVDDLLDYPEDDFGRMFTGQRRGQFLEYLTTHLAATPGVDAADRLLSSAIRPSKQLMSLAAEEVQNREQFVLLDEQQTAYSLVMRAVRRASRANTKEVIVIVGGPGSGKSVIALSLLGELSREGRTALHATGSKAFTQTLRKVAGSRAPRVKAMFRYFNGFVDAEPNGLNVLICDEAHRMRLTSANRFTAAKLRTGRAQVAELIDAARVPVFLLDQDQVVRPAETGTVEVIQSAARTAGVGIRIIELDGQFRCGGSRAYEEWVLRLLDLRPGGQVVWEGDSLFDVWVAQAPSELEASLRDYLDQGYGARLAAGYCWEWSDPVPEGLELDVTIGDWHKPWNNKKDTSHAGAPGTPFWASDPAGFEQVGCVYTAQGFEYDYAGVIIGNDFVWRDDHWVARPEHSHDSQAKRGSPEQFDRAIRNTYKVLLTRGMRGVGIMSTDPETQLLLTSLVPIELRSDDDSR